MSHIDSMVKALHVIFEYEDFVGESCGMHILFRPFPVIWSLCLYSVPYNHIIDLLNLASSAFLVLRVSHTVIITSFYYIFWNCFIRTAVNLISDNRFSAHTIQSRCHWFQTNWGNWRDWKNRLYVHNRRTKFGAPTADPLAVKWWWLAPN